MFDRSQSTLAKFLSIRFIPLRPISTSGRIIGRTLESNLSVKGLNSYNGFNWGVNELMLIANIDYVAANLSQFGYNIVCIDYHWYMATSLQTMYMDEFGRLIPDPNRFPSSQGNQRFKQIAAYAHSQGLLFGIRGVNQVAIRQQLPILGLSNQSINLTMDQVADLDKPCPWTNFSWVSNFYSLNLSNPASSGTTPVQTP